ncbi:unnamed protein product [Dovyalis caffra]|uniref:Toll-like receptor 5 n=1 Tax=Dovyalis caffra TaxID=77055 RepID=A0AAV1RPB2_9ROSI|nr:unnamed protein product [Dovyalis caffra]
MVEIGHSQLLLARNNLAGKIPSCSQLVTFDASSFFGNEICRVPFEENCTVINETPKGEGEGEKEANEVYVIMGHGFVNLHKSADSAAAQILLIIVANKGTQIPSFLGSLESLKYLNLSQAGFSGVIPHQLGNLSNLHYLDLQAGSVIGDLQVENLQWLSGLSSLKHLDLSGVNINNASNWLQVTSTPFFDRITLVKLHPLPSSFCSFHCFSKRLESLVMRSSQLSGHLINRLGQFKSLVELDLTRNSISGRLPESLGELSSLRSLGLASNKLNGTLPASLGLLENLKVLQISSNLLGGFVSEVHFAKLTRLVYFQASGNQRMLNVSQDWIPPFQLQTIGLSSWHLGPQFPPGFKHRRTSGTWIFHTQIFHASIPEELCSLASLQILDLPYNKLLGSIPRCVSNFSAMTTMSNSSNNYLGYNPFPGVFYENAVVVMKGRIVDYGTILQNCTVSPKVEGGEGQDQHREVIGFYVSMALGFVVSFWSVLGSLIINRRWRHTYFQFLDRMRYKSEDVLRKFSQRLSASLKCHVVD